VAEGNLNFLLSNPAVLHSDMRCVEPTYKDTENNLL
jgi:hypothetical protein